MGRAYASYQLGNEFKSQMDQLHFFVVGRRELYKYSFSALAGVYMV